MKHKTYILSSQLSAEETIARVGDLLTKAGVLYRTEGLSIVSTSTPIVLFFFQRMRYSNRNWAGLNPFAYISGVDVRCQSDKSGLTEIVVQVNRFRTLLFVAPYVILSAVCVIGLLAESEPEGAFFFLAFGFAAWLGCVSFLGGYLVKKEITNCLKA